MIRVRLSVVPGRSHNLYNEIVDLPPDGVVYTFPKADEIGYKPARDERPTLLQRARGSRVARAAWEPFVRHALGGVGLKERFAPAPRDHDVYHSVGTVHPKKEPWVVQLESSLDLFSFGRDWRKEMQKASSRRWVEQRLRSPHCKHILPETAACARSVLGAFPGSRDLLAAKMTEVQIALRAGPEPAPEPDGPPRFLFVGSRNFPKDFVPKGGHLVLAAFAEVQRKLPDARLTIRAVVPEPYRSRYAKQPGLTILDQDLPAERVAALYEEHHVFVFPGSSTPGMVIRENMRAARATVTIDVWANGELVQDGVTGLVAEAPDAPYLNQFGAHNWSHEPGFIEPFERNVERSVGSLAAAMLRLAEDAPLRRRMGQAARKEVVSGKFSIGVRNAKLKRIYEDAVRA